LESLDSEYALVDESPENLTKLEALADSAAAQVAGNWD
jgi:hypothetical protein